MEKELYNIITEKFLQCIPFIHENYTDRIFWGIDNQIIRQKKLNRILGKNEIYIGKPCKDIKWHFLQDTKNKIFYVDYDNFWSFFSKKYGYNYQEIKDLFNGWLKDTDKFEQYTTTWCLDAPIDLLKDTDKFEQYTTSTSRGSQIISLKDTDKFKQYTSQN
jgi:hypothetical protein